VITGLSDRATARGYSRQAWLTLAVGMIVIRSRPGRVLVALLLMSGYLPTQMIAVTAGPE
jgi:hypothetical protein